MDDQQDQQAIERYRYMLRTAPPDDIEGAHREAFEALTPEQRSMVLRELAKQLPENEASGSDDPQSLARMATRAEMRQPGTMERTFGGMQGPGMGGMFLATLAGAFVGSAIANQFFDESGTDGAGGDTGATDGDAGSGEGGDAGSTDGGDAGVGYEGGDIGGGDFGGGDFGGF